MKNINNYFRPILCLTQITFLFYNGNLLAQTNKNTIAFGTDIQLSTSNQINAPIDSIQKSTTKNSTLIVSPYFSYFLIDNIEIGAKYTFQKSESTNNSNSLNGAWYLNEKINQSDNKNSFGIFIKYHRPLIHEFGFLSELYFNYGFIKTVYDYRQIGYNSSGDTSIHYGNLTHTGNELLAGLSTGFEYYIKQRFGFELKIKMAEFAYSSIDSKETYQLITIKEEKITNSNFSFIPSPTLIFSIKYYIASKSKKK